EARQVLEQGRRVAGPERLVAFGVAGEVVLETHRPRPRSDFGAAPAPRANLTDPARPGNDEAKRAGVEPRSRRILIRPLEEVPPGDCLRSPPNMSRPTALVAALLAIAAPARAGDPATIDYARDVKPILAKHCVSCHGATKPRGGLRLDTAAAALKGGN